MKKILPILLIAILLFNWFGYRLLTSVLEERANSEQETAIDNNSYDESELIAIRIPVSYLPYYNNSSDFERVHGQVEIQGSVFNYVKRRIYNDSLELLCIPNHSITKLNAARDEMFRFVNGLQHTAPEKNSHSHRGSVKIFSPDYEATGPACPFELLKNAVNLPNASYSIAITSRHAQIVEQPPEFA